MVIPEQALDAEALAPHRFEMVGPTEERHRDAPRRQQAADDRPESSRTGDQHRLDRFAPGHGAHDTWPTQRRQARRPR